MAKGEITIDESICKGCACYAWMCPRFAIEVYEYVETKA